MNFNPTFARHQIRFTQAEFHGISPDGDWVDSVEHLPQLPLPRCVRITREALQIDGWVFLLSNLTKRFLVWLRDTFERWAKEDESARNREWIDGMADAFMEVVKKE